MIDKPSLSIEDYEICNKLKSMRFSGMAEALEEVLADPNAELLPFREKIQRIVDAEWNLRYTKKLNRFIKKATLKYPAADLDDTIYHPERQLDTHIIEELSKCEWIEQGKNLVITVIIPRLFEPPVRILRATLPDGGSHCKLLVLLNADYSMRYLL